MKNILIFLLLILPEIVFSQAPGNNTIELTGDGEKLDNFLRAVERDAILEVVRSGATGIARGQKALHI